MPNPTFFELSRHELPPIYINANKVVSVEFLGSAKSGYVACLVVDTLSNQANYFLWGDSKALDSVHSNPEFGRRTNNSVTITSPRPISPNDLFASKVGVCFTEEDAPEEEEDNPVMLF